MALDKTKLACLMQCSYGGEVWSYQTADVKATVLAANYFLPAQGQLQNNDRIHAWVGIGGVVEYIDIAILASTPASITVVSSAPYT
jgi:hypothetical protein